MRRCDGDTTECHMFRFDQYTKFTDTVYIGTWNCVISYIRWNHFHTIYTDVSSITYMVFRGRPKFKFSATYVTVPIFGEYSISDTCLYCDVIGVWCVSILLIIAVRTTYYKYLMLSLQTRKMFHENDNYTTTLAPVGTYYNNNIYI